MKSWSNTKSQKMFSCISFLEWETPYSDQMEKNQQFYLHVIGFRHNE